MLYCPDPVLQVVMMMLLSASRFPSIIATPPSCVSFDSYFTKQVNLYTIFLMPPKNIIVDNNYARIVVELYVKDMIFFENKKLPQKCLTFDTKSIYIPRSNQILFK